MVLYIAFATCYTWFLILWYALHAYPFNGTDETWKCHIIVYMLPTPRPHPLYLWWENNTNCGECRMHHTPFCVTVCVYLFCLVKMPWHDSTMCVFNLFKLNLFSLRDGIPFVCCDIVLHSHYHCLMAPQLTTHKQYVRFDILLYDERPVCVWLL